VAGELAPKLRKVRGGPAAMVALPREEADLAAAFVSEILPEPGIQMIGAIPHQIEGEAVFAGFVLKRSGNPAVASALLTYLAEPGTRNVYTTAGMSRSRDVPPAAPALP